MRRLDCFLLIGAEFRPRHAVIVLLYCEDMLNASRHVGGQSSIDGICRSSTVDRVRFL